MKHNQFFYYECTEGHWSGSPRPMESCIACIDGKPCSGEMIELTENGNRKRKPATTLQTEPTKATVTLPPD